MSRYTLVTAALLILIAVGATLAILYAKGYSLNPKKGLLVGTGIIAVTSLPTGASVYIDGHLTTATDTTISSLSPKKYQVKIVKEGFIPWEKTVEVNEGLVTDIKATLFPSLPTIYPLTYNGAVSPTLSPDGTELAFGVPQSSDSARPKGGVWVWTVSETPIAFARGAQPHQVVASTQALDFSKATLKFSPDSKQLLVTVYESGVIDQAHVRNYLLDVGSLTSLANLRDITPTLDATLKGWGEDEKTKNLARLEGLKDVEVKNIASASATPTGLRTQTITWSPDETKMLVYESLAVSPEPLAKNAKSQQPIANSSKKANIYDLGTTEKSFDKAIKYELPEAYSYQWLPDSRHVIMVNEGKISLIEFDGGNNAVVYAGNFDKNSVFPWSDSSKLVFISSYNTPTGNTPNLFGLNLK